MECDPVLGFGQGLGLDSEGTSWVENESGCGLVGHHGSGGMEVVLGVLSALSSRGINLTKLEVGSNRKEDGVVGILDVHGRRGIQEFPHVLYIDFEGTMEDEKVKEAIDEVSNLSVFVRVLGCYMADPNVYDLY